MARTSRTLWQAAGSLALLGVATTAYSLWEARQYTLRRVRVVHPPGPRAQGPPPERPLRICWLRLSMMCSRPQSW